MQEQLTLWGEVMPYYKLKQPVVLIEAFAGIGSQRKALEILGVKIDDEKSQIIEWAFNSYIGYNAIHIKDNTDYSKNLSVDELVEKVKGTSIDYNQPLTTDQLKKKGVEWLKRAYNNIVATHNLIDIANVKGEQLLFRDNQNQSVILTYSFPCQDLSLAGHRKGMTKGTQTRSGLLWEVERILIEREQQGLPLPNLLVMENVPDVIGSRNLNDFKGWELRLSQFGYTNYCEILNGKDYGIPQNRKRAFMISVLGEYAYDFPCKLKLNHCLEDLLQPESEVDKSFYLDEETINRIRNWNSQQNPLDNIVDTRERERVMGTITTRVAESQDGGMSASMRLVGFPKNEKVIKGTHTHTHEIKIKNNTQQGYLVAKKGDGIDISGRMETHRGTVQQGTSQTLTCVGGNDVGVVVNKKNE